MLDYDFICKVEEANLYKRFLPYAIGSPERYKKTPDNSYDRANFVFFTDSHIDFMESDACMDNLKRTVAFSNESPIKFDAMINAGDAITPFYEQDKSLPLLYAKSFFDEAKKSRSPFIFAKGNHDVNCWWNKPENVLTDSDYYNMFYWFASENYGTVHQKKANGFQSTWHYYDVEKHKIRIVSVDMQDIDKTVTNEKGHVKYFGSNGFYISDEQMNWIANVALNFDDKEDKEWGVILVCHHFPQNHPDYENAAEKLLDICVAFNNGDTYENHYKNELNSFFDIDVKADFTRYKGLEKKPHMICWLMGHIHDDVHEVHKGIHFIYTTNASASQRSGDARLLRIPGTVTQNAFDIMNIDTRTRKIRMFRYGAGVNCYGEGGDRFLPDGLDY